MLTGRMLAIAGAAALFLLVSPPRTSASPFCAAGNLASVMGTTCAIGTTTLTFTNFDSHNYLYDYTAQSYVYNSPWVASDFNFTPVLNGFLLTFLRGPLSFTAPTNAMIRSWASVGFDFTSAGITQVYISPGGAVSGSSGWSVVYNEFFLSGPGAQTGQHNEIDYNAPWPQPSQQWAAATAISSGSGMGYFFVLQINDGAGATYPDTTAITFDRPYQPSNVPEPPSVLLLAAGIFRLARLFRRRFPH